MILSNLIAANSGQRISVQVTGDRIGLVSSSQLDDLEADGVFGHALVFPGLINSHDHLDFNLFPQLGNRIYNNYREWGLHIHSSYADEIRAVLDIPKPLREQWGVYRNLLCGVTTVVNHGARVDLSAGSELITIHESTHDIHSTGHDPLWRCRLNNPFRYADPVVIHTGEGTDALTAREIGRLLDWNLLGRKMVAVHGVMMNTRQAGRFRALVWCPQSNYYLLDRTAPVNELKFYTDILFGTDSTLTGSWNAWEHLRFARRSAMLNDVELFQSCTQKAAETWGLNAGKIAPGRSADLVVARMKQRGFSREAFFNVTPADILLVMHKGQVRLIDESISLRSGLLPDCDNYNLLNVGGSMKYVQGDPAGLISQIRGYNPALSLPVSAA